MIGNDQVHAEPPGGVGRTEGADAHIHADDQTNARCSRALDHVIAHVIAITDAVWDMKISGASAEFYRSLQNDDGSCAVHVVVAVNQDGFVALDGGLDALDGSFH